MATFKGVKEEIKKVLEENPQELVFGVESFNFEAHNYEEVGYIYPASGGYGNMAEYMERENLEILIAS